MKTKRLIVALFVAAMLVPPSQAQQTDSRQQTKLIDELRPLVEKSRRERAADRWLQNALENLVAKYDWPWRNEILYEDFRDGDYTNNPAWEVASGDFRVEYGMGLRCVVDPSRQPAAEPEPSAAETAPETTPEQAIAGILVGVLLGPKKDQPQQTTPEAQQVPPAVDPSAPASISLQQEIPNAFALETTFRMTEIADANRFDIRLMQGEDDRYGYRLAIKSGKRGFIELERVRDYRSAVVEGKDLELNVADGQRHDLVWHQTGDGKVTVLLDGEKLFEAKDKAFRQGYKILKITNHSGDLTIRSIRISG